ncbi:hypothetical protein RHMOL_Rhmol02G0166900 [Rhododendron molle]|uniref:Uncharacterized protein n=1 Tax=Rhododendron molle TaxID=49168 RepID=A0ACC0PQS7_RHOML|nr:hypothetical protein RHMOL_Rhmol02G0166900 [Rhododendron molle]
MGFHPTPIVDQSSLNHWEGEWNAAHVDPLDDLSLFMLFHQSEPVVLKEKAEEYVWDPQPDATQLAWSQNFNMS